jgi:hypothetical protein
MSKKTQDEIYIEIWKIEQENGKTRWTVTSFFLSISFAILGFSFQADTVLSSHVQRIVGLILYWFGFFVFFQFSLYSKYLRGRLRQMEQDGGVSFDIQSEADKFMYKGIKAPFPAQRLLLIFGILYTIGAIVLFFIPIV